MKDHPDERLVNAMAATGSDLTGKRALITGAASGIGAAVARCFAAAGADVVVTDRAAGPVTELGEELGAEVRVADLSDPDEAAELGEGADIVVNNAGFQHVAPLHRFPPEVFGEMLRVMVESPFRIVRNALPGMYSRGWGRIVHISSVHGLRASQFKSAYVTAKHAVEGLSKVIAVEGASYGVTSNCICPGYVRTPLVERQIAEQAELHRVPEEQVVEDVLLARTPVKRLVEPAEVAELALWLCGPSAASVSGSSFPMDGGWTAN
ncbi:3-hydroxybutyrate dehydrogenase [Saccharopolyspora rectivirgula]|jgi:3-hydroxybutyrate dehydrogenase|uniref:3-hydroxybutyrate dehydrogenase n=1 Tax=Saccharopolyspora rectivirgula TaxID=28042 RepID=A0A073B1J2_9PSEU|nr:3-hydroxybutyrate dehydrogenase [Saccharopolyspora rectivirgula]KEI45117.1 3-hydroxybutyrate dehydrogenase [Saccharopolyspora rectivirgula]